MIFGSPTQTQWFPAAGREAEAKVAAALGMGVGSLSLSSQAGAQYGLRCAYSAEKCMYAIDGVWPHKILGEAMTDGSIPNLIHGDQMPDVPVTFGGRSKDAVKILSGVDPKSSTMTPQQTLALYYLANQRALRQWALGASPVQGPPTIDVVLGGESAGLPPGLPQLPGGAPNVPAATPGGGISFPVPMPQGGNMPGMPNFDPSKPIVFGGPPPGFGLEGLGALGPTIPANILLAAAIVVGVLGAAAIVVHGWVSAQEAEANKAVKIADTSTLNQVHLATELATRAIAAGQPISIPDIVRSVGTQELTASRWEPYLVGGAIAAALAAALLLARSKGVV